MPFYNESQLKKNIKEKDFARLYLIYGNEAYLKNHYIKSLAESAVTAGFESFNLHRFDAGNEKKKDLLLSLLSTAFEASQTVPVMSEYTCIIVKNFPLSSLTKAEIEIFEQGVTQIPSSSIMVFHMDLVEVSTKKTDKWQPILQFCSRQGVCAELNSRSTRSTTSLLSSGAKKRGCEMSQETAEYLISYSGDDLQILLNELEKLCAFVRSGEITSKNIDEVCIKSVEASIFDLAKTIIKKDAKEAYSIFSVLLSQKTEATIILGTLASAYVDIYRVKAAQNDGHQFDELSKLFSYKGKSFRLNNAAALGRGLSMKKIRRSIDILSQADLEIKFSSKPNQLILEELLARLLNL